MRLASLILALLSALLLAMLIRAQFAPDPAASAIAAVATPTSGLELLNSHPCRPGEARKVTMRGVEDHYAPAGDEPARLHPRVPQLYRRAIHGDPRFDAAAGDQALATWFDLSPSTASALLVMRLRAAGDNLNDTLGIGDLAHPDRFVSQPPASLGALPEWRRHGDLYWAELADIALPSGQSVLEAVVGQGGGRILDIQIVDDTEVDFIGVAACEAPARARGVTMAAIDMPGIKAPDVIGFECRAADANDPSCKPFVGDHSCDEALPLLCFQDLDLPAPAGAQAYSELSSRRWSGGEVAATAPVKGSSFRTIGDADRACASRFGKAWRVAEWHDGGNGFGFSANRGGRTFSGRYWVDIRGAPYGTCWRREGGR